MVDQVLTNKYIFHQQHYLHCNSQLFFVTICLLLVFLGMVCRKEDIESIHLPQLEIQMAFIIFAPIHPTQSLDDTDGIRQATIRPPDQKYNYGQRNGTDKTKIWIWCSKQAPVPGYLSPSHVAASSIFASRRIFYEISARRSSSWLDKDDGPSLVLVRGGNEPKNIQKHCRHHSQPNDDKCLVPQQQEYVYVWAVEMNQMNTDPLVPYLVNHGMCFCLLLSVVGSPARVCVV